MIYIYYRHCAKVNNIGRPHWFSTFNCFKNFLHTLGAQDGIKLTIALDGEDDFTSSYADYFSLFRTNYYCSLPAYRDLLKHIKSIPMDSGDLIYFVENDYLHTDNWIEKTLELFKYYPVMNYVSLYDHQDKYCLPMYDNLVSKVFITPSHHWRTTPSTCGTFLTTRKIFEEDFDVWFNAEGDHPTFLKLNSERGRFVVTPLPGFSTHCMEGLLSPTINWEKINNKFN